MKLIWTKSSALLSKAVRWGLGHDCSHFAIVFNSPAGGLMFEANLLGTHPRFFKTALAHGMEVVHELDLPISVEEENSVWDHVVDALDNKEYDYKGFLYFAVRGFLWRFFRVPFPTKNKWAQRKTYLCVAIFNAVKKYTVLKDVEMDISMTAPHALYSLLNGAKEEGA